MKNTQDFQVPFNDDDRFDTSRIDTTINSDDFDTFSFDNISEERDGGIHETSNDGINSKSNDASDSFLTNNQADIIDLPNDSKKHDDLSPGARLRKAREQKKLSLQEIADQLFLEVHIVEKLEANNYESLGAQPIFVRGYMRNYAKLVGLPEESFLEDFDNLSQGDRSPKHKNDGSTQTETKNNDLLPKIGIVVLVILIVLIGSWKFLSNTNLEDTTPAIVDVQQPYFNEESLTYIPNDSPPETMEDFQDEIRSDNPSESTVVMPEETTAVADEVPTTTEEQPVIDAPAPTKESLRVHLKEEVWMRISDNSDKELFSDLAQAGDVLNLEGKPPFYLKTARYGLDIEYQGEIKGIKSYPKTQRGKITIFVIGSDE
ncbi:hypothetical protein PN36_17900 [Candidatus Thiomargarita nelsonii]|uniref:Cytoskeleton protein RodZ-like C-terminal domain-containing protein n=1 Tax=Candidatus Thiomargarita nelsonii TaxID=1003181 RepID=A0A4E0QPJ4_9GAMM|nr:hypothetical protein PN36_17900 [Candidatus Thiomargarita nelsonii]